MTEEKTFRSFTDKQGANYAKHRRSYSPKLYKLIIDHHTSTGGKLETLLDVGCGPGIATLDLAPHFATVIGLDPSEGMITTARSLGGTSNTSQGIRYEISTAEELGSKLSDSIPDASVDLITSATAAHWFDMSRFWPRAAQVLKPGGSVALWSSNSLAVHPSVPNAAAIQAFLTNINEEGLKPHMVEGNLLGHNLYRELLLPWTLESPVLEFEESTFFRKEWSKGGEGDEFFAGQPAVSLDMMEKMLSTASPTIRWRQAHPEDVGTERDVVRRMRLGIEKLLHEAGVEEGKEMVKGDTEGVLLIVKKKE